MTRFVQLLLLTLFCLGIGETMAAFLTAWMFRMSTAEVFEALKDPVNASQRMLLTLWGLSTALKFVVVPGLYLELTNKQAVSFMRPDHRIRIGRALMAGALMVGVVPCISFLFELNYNIGFPSWLEGAETYFRESKESAQTFATSTLTLKGPAGLVISILVVAVVPGFAEEFFFRGIVQTQLYEAFRNRHYAVFLSTALFGILHLQFFAIIPLMVSGLLLGYLYLWTKNIWYPVIAHIANNIVFVLGYYFYGADIMTPTGDMSLVMTLLAPSILVSGLILWRLRKTGHCLT